MENYKKHIDSFIREKAGRGPQTPPPHIWDALDKQLDGLNKSKRPLSYRWMQYFGIASLILLLSATVAMKIWGNSNTEHNSTTQANTDNTTATTQAKTENTATAPESSATTTNAAQPTPATTNTETNTTTPTENNTTPNATGTKTVATDKPAQQADKPTRDNAIAGNETHKDASATHVHKSSNEVAANSGTKGGRKSKTNTATALPINNYNSTTNNDGSKAPVPIAGEQTANEPISEKKQEQPIPGTFKNESTNGIQTNTPATKPAPVESKLPKQPTAIAKKENTTAKKADKEPTEVENKIEEGIKAGYESWGNNIASKYVVSPYIQYNITPKISLLIQPGIKYGQLATKNVGTPQSYYSINGDGSVAQNGNSILNVSGADSTYTTKYTYTETHDSIVKSYAVTGTYWEVELPVLFKYYLAKKISVFGGVNLIYSQLSGIKENTYTEHNIPKSVDFATVTPGLPTSMPAAQDISYSGSSFDNYNHPLFSAPQAGHFHIGYMIGFGYELNSRWLLDGLMQQSPVKKNVIGGYNVNAALSSPYFRLSIGYRLQNNIRLTRKGKVFGDNMDTGRGD